MIYQTERSLILTVRRTSMVLVKMALMRTVKVESLLVAPLSPGLRTRETSIPVGLMELSEFSPSSTKSTRESEYK